jgi:hypothetical protein
LETSKRVDKYCQDVKERAQERVSPHFKPRSEVRRLSAEENKQGHPHGRNIFRDETQNLLIVMLQLVFSTLTALRRPQPGK